MEESEIGNSFTWFKQFNGQIAEMTEEEQFAFIPEVVLWAAFGREPSFMNAKDQTARYFKQAFLGMKNALDNSIRSQNRNTGGAPKKKKTSGKKKETGGDNPPTEPPL